MKKLIFLAVLTIGLIFTACQNQETKPAAEETVAPLTDETTTITIPEGGNTKTLESPAFSITVSANLTMEANDEYGRIQNFTPDSDLYTLKDGEYFIELTYVLNDKDSPYSEETFRSEYKTVEESDFNGTKALYGIDRLPAGDSPTGVGYYIADTLAIGIFSESESGIKNAKEILANLKLK